MTYPRKYRGCLLWPILNDDTGKVDYWEVHPPCPHKHTRRRADGTIEKAQWLDCCHYHEPEATATELDEARQLTLGVKRSYDRSRALDRFLV